MVDNALAGVSRSNPMRRSVSHHLIIHCGYDQCATSTDTCALISHDIIEDANRIPHDSQKAELVPKYLDKDTYIPV